MVYIWQASLWCDSCGAAIIDDLKLKVVVGDVIDTGDSDDYPQRVHSGGESDSPYHCGAHEECLEAIELPSGRKVGAVITETLTEDGILYVRETMKDGGEVAEIWSEEFEVNLLCDWPGCEEDVGDREFLFCTEHLDEVEVER